MDCRPFPKSIFAPVSLSKRSFDLRFAASGPWHVKHLSDKIGRISRLNSTEEEDCACAAAGSQIMPPRHTAAPSKYCVKEQYTYQLFPSEPFLLCYPETHVPAIAGMANQVRPGLPAHPAAARNACISCLPRTARLLRDDRTRSLENCPQHIQRQLPRGRVLLARMVRAQQHRNLRRNLKLAVVTELVCRPAPYD